MTGPTAEQIAEWQRVTDAATEGPWCFYGDDLWRGTAEEWAAYDADPETLPVPWDDKPWPDNLAHIFHGDPVYPHDAEFIAAAREAMPLLLEYLRVIRAAWDQRGDAAAMWGLAENASVPLTDRLQCARQALSLYEPVINALDELMT